MSTLVNVFQFTQLWFNKHSRQFKRGDAIDLCSRVQNVSKAMVCLPKEAQHLYPAKEMLEVLTKAYSNWRVTLVYDNRLSPGNWVNKYENYSFSEQELTFFGRPKKELTKTLSKLHPDVAFDLSHDYNFTNVSLVWLSRADIRVGFYHDIRKDFYNFLFRKKPQTPVERSYQLLFEYFHAL